MQAPSSESGLGVLSSTCVSDCYCGLDSFQMQRPWLFWATRCTYGIPEIQGREPVKTSAIPIRVQFREADLTPQLGAGPGGSMEWGAAGGLLAGSSKIVRVVKVVEGNWWEGRVETSGLNGMRRVDRFPAFRMRYCCGGGGGEGGGGGG